MPAVKTHTEELRAALIDEAGRVLRTEGPGAVTLRRLARATGTSTAAVYTLFGDKAGLIDQMYIEGFRRLTHTVAASPATADPVQDLLAMGGAYRRAALRSRHLYELMFGRPVPGFKPSPGAIAVARRAFQPLLVAVSRCVEAGAFRSDTDPEDVAYHMWALAHGLVALEIHRALPLKRAEFERRYASAISASIASYLAPARSAHPA
ncbi:MAG TPA: TetR/AcrR family transcriptional regulator [Acidimicrobiales bacterium]|nr:TetR/AcrR family transcriptional regulator [Acidimicrobiales bacterium]